MSASTAWSQQATAAPAEPTQVQEIVVTAQLRAQKLIDVPITITALNGKTLTRLGIQDLHDLSLHTPGFYVQNQSVNDPGIVMRGVTTDATTPTNEPRVSIYQDGVSISQIPATSVELFDLDRVEVAKGPQTTLYGRSALTGAVNIIDSKATESGYDWSAHAEGGNSNYGLLEGMVNMPLGDDFALRIAVRGKQRDGYISNLAGGPRLNGVNTDAARISLNFHPNDRLNDDFIVNYEYDHPSGTDFKSTTFYPSNPTTGQVLGNLSPYSAASITGSPLLENGAAPNVRRNIVSATNILTYQINAAFKLTSTSGVRRYYGAEVFDADGTALPILSVDTSGSGNQYSQDFRLNYDPGGKISAFGGISALVDDGQEIDAEAYDERLALALLTGTLDRTNPVAQPTAYYTNANVMSAEVYGLLDASGLALSGGPFGAEAQGIASNLSSGHYEQYVTGSHTHAYDAYLDGTYRPIDTVELSAGVRYSEEYKTSSFAGSVGSRSALGGVFGVAEIAKASGLNPATTGNCSIPQVYAANQLCQILAGLSAPPAYQGALPLFGIQVQPTVGNGNTEDASLNDGGLSWRFTARYKPVDNLDFYATYARGRRPEVLTAEAPTAPFGAARFVVAPAETLDSYETGVKSRLFDGRLSLDGAIYLYNYQHFQTTLLEGNQFVTSDAGNARTYGFEGQASFAVTSLIDLFATYTFTHGRYTNGILDGNQFRLTPEDAVTLGGDWRIPGFGGFFEVVPSYRWQSKVYFNDDNGNKTIQEEEGPLVPPLLFNQYQNAYSLLDLRVGYSPLNAHWKLEAFASNLTDTRYLKDSGNTGIDLGLPTDIPGEPRFYGISFTIRR